jgi:GDPmannose 4,6-dehydratase
VARVACGGQERIALGNLALRRDWDRAPDHVEAMWRMLQHDEPDGVVIASGLSHSIVDSVAAVFAAVGLDRRDHDPTLARPSDIL